MHAALTTPRHLNHAVIRESGLQRLDEVPGLAFSEDFLTPEEESYCIKRIDAAGDEWLDDLSRRVQHYGCRSTSSLSSACMGAETPLASNVNGSSVNSWYNFELYKSQDVLAL